MTVPLDIPEQAATEEIYDGPQSVEAATSYSKEYPLHHHRRYSVASAARDDQSDKYSETTCETYDDMTDLDEDASDGTPENVLFPNKMRGFNDKEIGSRDQQLISIDGTDSWIEITGLNIIRWRLWGYYLLCIFTAGLGYLLLRWFSKWRIRLLYGRASFKECHFLSIRNESDDVEVVKVTDLAYEDYLSTIVIFSKQFAFSDDPYSSVEQEDTFVRSLRSFEWRYSKFFLHPRDDWFVRNYYWSEIESRGPKEIIEGLDDVIRNRSPIFGKNAIEIQEKSIVYLLMNEALHPFYIFQIFSMILWAFEQYYYYASAIFVISLFTIGTTIYYNRRTTRRLHELSRSSCMVRVVRNGFWESVNSENLLPGDVFELSDPSLQMLPCDAILLAGDAIVNESLLTGESLPITKHAIKPHQLKSLNNRFFNISSSVSRHYLFGGTKLVQIRKPRKNHRSDQVATALVVRTGFNSVKGELTRSMLFSQNISLKFYRDSFKFLLFSSGIALCGLIYSVINSINLGISKSLLTLRALDLITVVIPPALPATLSIGTNFAISRLRKSRVFCTSPTRLNIAGQLNIMVFDKTGTLTEEGLDIMGVVPCTAERKAFGDLTNDWKTLSKSGSSEIGNDLLYAMASCHALRKVGYDYIGDPLELKMFEFSGWHFEDDGQAKKTRVIRPTSIYQGVHDRDFTLRVKKTFEFIPSLRRMSVVVQVSNEDSYRVFLKGAPEVIVDLCDQTSIPPNFSESVHKLTHNGFRIIACASKEIPRDNKFVREDVEADCKFLGFIVFENKLKPETIPALRDIRKANIRTIMCTGDNLLTAIYIARESGLVHESTNIFVPQLIEDADNCSLTWTNFDDSAMILDPDTLLPLDKESKSEQSTSRVNGSDYCLGLTGDIFNHIVLNKSESYLQRMLLLGSVFARMAPDEKKDLIDHLKRIDYVVGFCGDGANDCNALSAADAGISLSEAEASVAAPFTSKIFNISCVPYIIREGRAALVTSFACFKYMCLYSIIQLVSLLVLYRMQTNLGDFQFLFIDLFISIPLAILFGRSAASRKLSARSPPTTLISTFVIGRLVGQIFLVLLFQVAIWYASIKEPWAIRPVNLVDESQIACTDTTVIFLFSVLQYTLISIVLNTGPPFRRSIIYNGWYMGYFLFIIGFHLFLLFFEKGPFYNLFELTKTPIDFKIYLLLAGLGYFVAAYVGEKIVFERWSRAALKFAKKLLRKTDHVPLYAQIERTLENDYAEA